MTLINIIEAVSKASGVTVEGIKSFGKDRKSRDARNAYFQTAMKHGFKDSLIYSLVNRKSPNSARNVCSDKLLLSRVYSILGAPIKRREMFTDTPQFVVGGDGYSIHDVSSRYFGGCFVIMKNGEAITSKNTYREAINEISAIKEKLSTIMHVEP